MIFKDNRKKILLIAPHLSNGGAEKVLSELSHKLNEHYLVYIMLFSRNLSYSYSGTLIVMDENISSSASLLKKLLFLNRIKRINKIETTISFLTQGNILNILSTGKKIITIHTNLSELYKRKSSFSRIKNYLIIRFLYGLSKKIVVVSNGIKDDLINNFRIRESKLNVIYNGFDFGTMKKKSKEDISDLHQKIFEKPTIINIGRLTNSKGQWNLLKVFKKLHGTHDWNLIILGEGKYQKKFKEYIEFNNLSSSVFLLGYIKNPYPYIRKSEIMILSSKYEGLSNVLIEGIALSTAVITTNCKSGPLEIIKPIINTIDSEIKLCHCGLLIPVKYPEKFNLSMNTTIEEKIMQESIKLLMSNKNLRDNLKNNGIMRSLEFDISIQINKWQILIEN